MGKFTENIMKDPKKRPYGQGTAALVTAVMDHKQHTAVEQFLLAYGGDDALADFLDWLPTAAPTQHWTCEVTYQANNLISYLDPTCVTVMVRETPRGRWLPYKIPCASFIPDESLRTVADAVAEAALEKGKGK